MSMTIHDAAPLPKSRSQRLSKPSIDLDTALYGISLLRGSLGLVFLAHGLLKVFTFTLPGTAQFFASVGLPGSMATPVALAEIIGGILLVAGVYTRWIALGLFPVALVATFKVHGGNGWLFTNEGGGWEFPAFLAIACIVQFLLGDGALSLSPKGIGKFLHRQTR